MKGEVWESRLLRAWPLCPPVASLSRGLAQYTSTFRLATPLTRMDSKPSNGLSMTYATAAPATAGGQPGAPVRLLFWHLLVKARRLLRRVSNFCSYLIDSILNRRNESLTCI